MAVSANLYRNAFLIRFVIQFQWVLFETTFVGEMSRKGFTEIITWRNFDFDALPSRGGKMAQLAPETPRKPHGQNGVQQKSVSDWRNGRKNCQQRRTGKMISKMAGKMVGKMVGKIVGQNGVEIVIPWALEIRKRPYIYIYIYIYI